MAMMISKFNKLIHNKTVWLVFAILISVAFVGVYTGQKASSGRKQTEPSKEVVGRLFGEDVMRQEFGHAYQSVYIMYCMMSGRSVNIDDEIDRVVTEAAWKRLATLKKAESMGLVVLPDQVRAFIQRQSVFSNPQTGAFERERYDAFVTGFLPQVGMNVKRFEQMVAENVLIEKALSMAAQGALVTDDEIRNAFHLYSDKLTVEYAAIPRSLVKTPEVSEADAKAYYTRNPDEFRLPEKAIVRYVQIPVVNYTNTVTVTDDMIASYYESNKQLFVKPTAEDTSADAIPEYQPLDEVKQAIREQYTANLARQQAFNIADELVARLSDSTVTFDQAAQQAGLEIIANTPAFAATDIVRGVDPSAPFARAAFNLENDVTHYYSDPVIGRDFIYVIALEKKLPSFLPAFDIVKDDATEAARIVAAETAYIEKAQTIYAEIAASTKEGTTFADTVSSYGMDLKTTEPFDASTQLEDAFGREIMIATAKLDAGSLANLIPTSDEYLVACVKSRELGDETTDLPAIRAGLSKALHDQKSAQLIETWQAALLEEAEFEDFTGSNES